MTVLRYLPFVISFRDEEHPEVDERKDDVEPKDRAHIKRLESQTTCGSIEDDRLHDPPQEEKTQSNVQNLSPTLPTREGVKGIRDYYHQRQVKQTTGEGFERQAALRGRTVLRRDGEMTAFLLPPLFESAFGGRPSETFARDHHRGVGSRSYMVDKEIIVSGTCGHQMRETTGLKEKRFLVRQVTSHTHIRMSAKGSSEVMESVEEGVKLNKAVEMTLVHEISTKAKDYIS